ncbi:MAG TPA: DnaJ domain-containing protein [Methylotenera sp.]
MLPNHDINRAASIKLLWLVLALHRKELVDIPDAGHTDDILLLLRLANGDAELMAWATGVTGASAEELRVSCVAFVERICFGGDTNPFGVLGLNPWANADAVKEHYRLLIRIFHPDRGQVGNATAEAYSARINQAYASLKHKVGDGGGNLSEPATASYRGQTGIIPRRFSRPVSAQNNGGDSLRWASRLTPAKVLLGMALLAGLIIYLSFPQKMRTQSGVQNVVEKPVSTMPALSYTSVTQMPVAEVEPLLDVVADAGTVEVVTQVEDTQAVTAEPLPMVAKSFKAENALSLKTPLVKVTPAAAVGDKKATAVNIKLDTKSADTKQVNTKPIETKLVNKTQVIQTAVIAAPALSNEIQSSAESHINKKANVSVTDSVKLVEASEIPVQPKTVTPKPVDIPTDRELHDLIASFMINYANGDINAFIQAFDEQVRSDEGGGKSGLYSAYADLFAKTTSRSIVLKDLQWKRQGTFAVAFADYRASTLRAGETQVNSSFGTLQIEAVKTGGRVMISGFFYQNAKK